MPLLSSARDKVSANNSISNRLQSFEKFPMKLELNALWSFRVVFIIIFTWISWSTWWVSARKADHVPQWPSEIMSFLLPAVGMIGSIDRCCNPIVQRSTYHLPDCYILFAETHDVGIVQQHELVHTRSCIHTRVGTMGQPPPLNHTTRYS